MGSWVSGCSMFYCKYGRGVGSADPLYALGRGSKNPLGHHGGRLVPAIDYNPPYKNLNPTKGGEDGDYKSSAIEGGAWTGRRTILLEDPNNPTYEGKRAAYSRGVPRSSPVEGGPP